MQFITSSFTLFILLINSEKSLPSSGIAAMLFWCIFDFLLFVEDRVSGNRESKILSCLSIELPSDFLPGEQNII